MHCQSVLRPRRALGRLFDLLVRAKGFPFVYSRCGVRGPPCLAAFPPRSHTRLPVFAWLFISFLAGRTFPYWPLRNYSECADRYIRLKGDGTWVAPKFGKVADTPEGFGNLATDCEFGHGTLGGPKGAREQSIADYRAFLKEALRLP